MTRPAAGRCTTEVQFISPPGAEPTVLALTGVCQLVHLGRVEMTATQYVYSDGHFTNQTIYAAANGDLLATDFAGQVVGQDASAFPMITLSFIGTETYDGQRSTGRFAGASGSSAATGSSTFNALTGLGVGQYTTKGSIRY
ncbi:MAG: hypothetical protein ABR551_04295 [Gemmatimonadales bacterium]